MKNLTKVSWGKSSITCDIDKLTIVIDGKLCSFSGFALEQLYHLTSFSLYGYSINHQKYKESFKKKKDK